MGDAGFDFTGTERYRVVRQLGEGAMGVVFEAEDREGGQRVAIKVIRGAHVDEIYRLKREFRALADLSHPNLVDLYELVADGPRPFVTMELVTGVTFVDYCRKGVPAGARCDERRLRAMLVQLVGALGAVHAAGMIHRDIKPSNVLVDANGRVVVLDFGLVTDWRHRDRPETNLVGTPAYMAPEQAADEPLSPAADWYAVGVLLYEALTGHAPFGGSVMEVLMAKTSHPAPPPRARVPDVPEDLDQLCVALMARSPERRPAIGEILRRLGVGTDTSIDALTSMPSSMGATPFCGREAELDRKSVV